jgi:ribosomal protein S30
MEIIGGPSMLDIITKFIKICLQVPKLLKKDRHNVTHENKNLSFFTKPAKEEC